jgi:hypothetical protein
MNSLTDSIKGCGNNGDKNPFDKIQIPKNYDNFMKKFVNKKFIVYVVGNDTFDSHWLLIFIDVNDVINGFILELYGDANNNIVIQDDENEIHFAKQTLLKIKKYNHLITQKLDKCGEILFNEKMINDIKQFYIGMSDTVFDIKLNNCQFFSNNILTIIGLPKKITDVEKVLAISETATYLMWPTIATYCNII